ITVLRGGRVVETVARAETTPAALARAMVGREVTFRVAHDRAGSGEPILTVEELTAADDRGLPALRGLSFVLHRGEILGVAGGDGPRGAGGGGGGGARAGGGAAPAGGARPPRAPPRGAPPRRRGLPPRRSPADRADPPLRHRGEPDPQAPRSTAVQPPGSAG